MSYYTTIYGTTINEDQVVVPMEEGNPLYIDYVTYLQNNGEVFETDYLTDIDLAIQRKLLVPQEVQLWRVRTILRLLQLEETIATALDALEEPTKTGAKTIWEYGTTIERQSQTVLFLQSTLQMTDDQVDDIFIQAQDIQL
jgi:hypothetical protein